jgi:hypothetical protein
MVNPEPTSTISFNENGGLSNNDETMGEEQDTVFAMLSKSLQAASRLPDPKLDPL